MVLWVFRMVVSKTKKALTAKSGSPIKGVGLDGPKMAVTCYKVWLLKNRIGLRLNRQAEIICES